MDLGPLSKTFLRTTTTWLLSIWPNVRPHPSCHAEPRHCLWPSSSPLIWQETFHASFLDIHLGTPSLNWEPLLCSLLYSQHSQELAHSKCPQQDLSGRVRERDIHRQRGLGCGFCQTPGRDKGPCLGDGCGQGLLEPQRRDNCDKEWGNTKNGKRPTAVILMPEW